MRPKPALRHKPPSQAQAGARRYFKKPSLPLPNYSLSSVCPACNGATQRIACKVRCNRCGFMWDCSEL